MTNLMFYGPSDITSTFGGEPLNQRINLNDLNESFSNELQEIGFGVHGDSIRSAFWPLQRALLLEGASMVYEARKQVNEFMQSDEPLIRNYINQFLLNYALVHGICTDDQKLIVKTLDLGANPNAQLLWHGTRITALVEAATRGNIDAVGLMLLKNVNPNIAKANSETPLAMAANNGYVAICRLLLGAGANPNMMTYGGTALAVAQDLETIKILVENGADVNIPDKDGDLPIIGCMDIRDYASVEYLISAGTDLHHENKRGLSAIDHAKRLGDSCILQMVNQESDDGQIGQIIDQDTEKKQLEQKRVPEKPIDAVPKSLHIKEATIIENQKESIKNEQKKGFAEPPKELTTPEDKKEAERREKYEIACRLSSKAGTLKEHEEVIHHFKQLRGYKDSDIRRARHVEIVKAKLAEREKSKDTGKEKTIEVEFATHQVQVNKVNGFDRFAGLIYILCVLATIVFNFSVNLVWGFAGCILCGPLIALYFGFKYAFIDANDTNSSMCLLMSIVCPVLGWIFLLVYPWLSGFVEFVAPIGSVSELFYFAIGQFLSGLGCLYGGEKRHPTTQFILTILGGLALVLGCCSMFYSFLS